MIMSPFSLYRAKAEEGAKATAVGWRRPSGDALADGVCSQMRLAEGARLI